MGLHQTALLLLLAAFPLATFGPLWSSFRSFVQDAHLSAVRFTPVALSFILICLSYAALLCWPLPLRCCTGSEISYEQLLCRLVAAMMAVGFVLGTFGARCFHVPRLLGCGKHHGRPFSPTALISSNVLSTVDVKHRWIRNLLSTSVLLIICWAVRELIAAMPV
ncbi:MAG TPA: hypothetical protein V6D22_26085 [Candidatus Obscuribacterales bacterium]